VQELGNIGERVRARARELGFDAVGFARADQPLGEEHDRYLAFVAAGMHGGMTYVEEHAELRRRLDTEGILSGARSVVCVARSYRRTEQAGDSDPAVARMVARYARGHDYHHVVRRQLRRLAVFLRGLGDEANRVHARPMCDDVPVLERAWAVRAGLGFVGKNGVLVVPGVGSMVILGEVVTTLDLPPDSPMSARCGACTRCLDACPTRAIVRPHVIDARRCVSYLTMELEGAVPEPLREPLGEHLYGCDDCQAACPFNHGEASRVARGRTATFEPLPFWGELSLASLLSMDDVEWQALATGSALKRLPVATLAKTAAVILGNRRDVASRSALARAAEHHLSEVVREAGRWALSRLPA
jgi:epoxyqueuosine reductase